MVLNLSLFLPVNLSDLREFVQIFSFLLTDNFVNETCPQMERNSQPYLAVWWASIMLMIKPAHEQVVQMSNSRFCFNLRILRVLPLMELRYVLSHLGFNQNHQISWMKSKPNPPKTCSYKDHPKLFHATITGNVQLMKFLCNPFAVDEHVASWKFQRLCRMHEFPPPSRLATVTHERAPRPSPQIRPIHLCPCHSLHAV